MQWLTGAPSLWVKWLGHENDHSRPSSAEMNMWSSTPNTPSWHHAQLKKSTGTSLPLPLHSPDTRIQNKFQCKVLTVISNHCI